MVYIDRLSGWPSLTGLPKDTTTRSLVKAFRTHFMDYGAPQILRNDGGPQFTSVEFKRFLENWGVEQVISSPHYAQSNGLAESAVKSMKRIIQKNTENGVLDIDGYHKGVLEFRNTPRQNGKTPAEVVFGREMRAIVPQIMTPFKREWIDKQKQRDCSEDKIGFDPEIYYNTGAKRLPNLHVGDKVHIQDEVTKEWSCTGIIVETAPYRKNIRLPSGRIMIRNRRFL